MSSELILGQKIKYYRNLHAMTQGELAAVIGVEAVHIANIERGRRGISIEKLVLLCQRFHISVSDILPIEAQDDSELRKTWITEILSVVDALDTTQLRTVKAMVCSLLAE